MPSPWKSPSGVFYLRERLPAAVNAADELTLHFRIGEASRIVRARKGGHVKVSLRTRDPGQARALYRDASVQLSRQLEATGATGTDLTDRHIQALAGEWYWAILRQHGDTPGCPEALSVSADHLSEALAFFELPDPDDPVGRNRHQPYDPARGNRELARLLDRGDPPFGAFLSQRGLSLVPTARSRLMQAIAVADVQATRQLERHAHGDFAPDPTAARFPEWVGPSKAAADTCPIGSLIDAWALERHPRKTTERDFRASIGAFVAFVGHDDAARFTAKDVIRWKDSLVAAGASPKTINDAKLAALKSVLGYAVENERLSVNVTTKVKAHSKDGAGKRMLGYSDAEAKTILDAALRQPRPAVKWVPWLCAMTGARVAEICQLRKEDVTGEDGVSSIDITPEAGALKNRTSERKVPLHPALIEMGFPAFVAAQDEGPLFIRRGREGATAKAGKSLANDLSEWVRGLGLKVGRAHRKDPNHAWRHRFTTLARRHGMDPEKREAILGHRLAGEAATYGEMAGLYAEIVKLPAPGPLLEAVQ